MTVPISKAISSVYLGDGLQTVFAFPFKVFTADDILVSINNGEYISEADANTYSVEINVGDTAGGNITLNNPLPEGQKLVILRDVKFEQAIPQSNGQAHYAEDFEKMVDLLTFQTQYLAEKISRCIELDPTITPTLTELIERVNSAASSAEQSKTAAESAVNTMTGQVATHNTAENPHPGKFEPAGTIIINPHENIPAGYLECNGAEISRTTYPELFSAIGIRYGIGNGETTFNIPDLRGYFLRGWDHGAGNDPDAATRTDRGDGTIGDNIGTQQNDEFKSHTHTAPTYPNAGSGTDLISDGTGTAVGTLTTAPTGGNETRPKNINVMYCIKY